MSKEYFSHDYNARNDPRLTKLAMKYGMDGIGIYWCVIEMLYEQNGYITLDNIENIAYELHVQCERITDVLRNFDLFRFEENRFYSESVLRRLQLRNDKSNSARESALKRWNTGRNANAMRTHSDSNAIKVNESKVNKNKRIRKPFIPPSLEEVENYFTENGYNKEAAKKAWMGYNAANWFDSKGNPVLSWKQKMINVWFKDENKIKVRMLA